MMVLVVTGSLRGCFPGEGSLALARKRGFWVDLFRHPGEHLALYMKGVIRGTYKK